MRILRPWQGVVLAVLIIIILAIAMSMEPVDGMPCMDVWCLPK
jgi:hypothetical protein